MTPSPIHWAGQSRSYFLIDYVDNQEVIRHALFSDSVAAAASEGREIRISKHPHIKFFRDIANYIFTMTGDPLTDEYNAASAEVKTERFANSVGNYING